jgi:hypothetical protein
MQRLKHHYTLLPPNSKARKLFVHFSAHFGDWRLLEKSDDKDFLVGTREVIMRGTVGDDPVVRAGILALCIIDFVGTFELCEIRV